MIRISQPQFIKTFSFFNKLKNHDVKSVLDRYGKKGVAALSAATPVDTGEAASSWAYRIEGNREHYKLIWTNSAMAGRTPVVLMIQYGHATKSGGWYDGKDFVNPAIRPIFDELNEALFKEVTG